jgi:hypothetical protein
LFREAGNVIRADIKEGPDGRPKGTGVVLFETKEDAEKAMSTFDGYEWHGRKIEVREVRCDMFKLESLLTKDAFLRTNLQEAVLVGRLEVDMAGAGAIRRETGMDHLDLTVVSILIGCGNGERKTDDRSISFQAYGGYYGGPPGAWGGWEDPYAYGGDYGPPPY